MRVGSFLKIARPANVLTAISDIIAGIAISGLFSTSIIDNKLEAIILLVTSTTGLYSGGIVFNDIFDFEEDRLNRPERVLPSGKISKSEAIIFGSTLFIIGIISAFFVSALSGFLAIAITVLALSYDKFGKHHSFLGPVNMGLCRSFNLLLGMSILSGVIEKMWFIGFIPLLFISAITLVGQKEAHGNNKSSVLKAIFLDVSIVLFFVFLMWKGYLNIWLTIPFLVFWFGINFFSKTRAYRHNKPKHIQQAVKMGVLSLIPLNAIYVAGFSNGYYALLLLCLLPISIRIAKYYAVT